MKRTLIRGATIISLDAGVGDLAQGDILIEGERIAAIAPQIKADEAQVIDAAGMIAIPGMIDAHLHTWQTGLRGVAGNWTILEYFRNMHAGLATKFKPEDIRTANLAGALNQINCGVTTLVDWCHNNPTPAHTDAAIEGLAASGIRAAFFHGTPKPDPQPGQRPFWESPHPKSEVERLLKSGFAGGNKLLTLGMAILGPHYSTYEVAVSDFKLAREFGLIASMHCAGAEPRTPDGWDRLGAEGLLGDNNNIVHGNNLTDAQLAFMLEKGVTFTLTPETEMAQGHGFAITGRLRKLGARPSFGTDLEAGASGDMFTVARLALSTQRAIDNEALRAQTGALPPTSTIRCREALEWISVEGARMLRMADCIGTLSPGKQADLVLLDAGAINMWPVHDPVASVITQAGIANVDSVMIAGVWAKRCGRLLYPDMEKVKAELQTSSRRIVAEMGLVTAS